MHWHNCPLSPPTDDSITVNLVPDQNGDVYFEYGTESGVYTDQTSTLTATAGEPVEVVIDELATSRLWANSRLFNQNRNPLF